MQATPVGSTSVTAARPKGRPTIDGLALVLCSLLLCSGPAGWASAQPLGWSLHIPFEWGESWLSVINLATGAHEATFSGSFNGVDQGGGLTPDGRYYLVAAAGGIARFRTDPIGFDGLIGPAAAVHDIAISPTGRRVHAFGPSGRHVVDWETGDVMETSCCERLERVHLTPDGAIRVQAARQSQAALTLTAISEQTGAVLWTRGFDGYLSEVAVSNSRVALITANGATEAAVVLDVADGSERARLDGFSARLAWRGDDLLASRYLSVPVRRLRLSAFDDTLSNERVLLEREPAPGYGWAGPVVLSYDARHAYWVKYGYPEPSRFNYEAIDLNTNAVIGGGVLDEEFWALSVEAADRCTLGVPGSVAGPVEGGSVGIPVVPAANCRPWSVVGQPAVLNPGPHAGPATVFVRTWPNALATEKTTPVSIGGQAVLVTQPSGVPTAPTLDAAVVGDRLALSWTPAIGAGIGSFAVRGGVAGSPVTDVLRLPGHLRTWTSPPLAPGSYQVELVAANDAGRSPPSNSHSLSVGVSALPEAPTGLAASVADDRVALSWRPPGSGPAPAGFVIEAAAAGKGGFAAVARSGSTSFVATRVPAGSWQVRVRATTAGGVSRPSDVVTVTTAPCSAPPAAPQVPWALWTPPAVTLRWSPPPSGSVEDYVIEVGTASGRSDVGRLVVPGTRVSHTEQVSLLAAFARVRARNACGESAPSVEVPIVLY